MKNENNLTGRKKHDITLAVLLIILIWTVTLICGTIMSWIFRDNNFLIRYILILPFSFLAVIATRVILAHHSK
jgi:ABC-type sulfate transport system permease subunit